jgi:3-oxoacyl-[acyl-carrier protein] reductase
VTVPKSAHPVGTYLVTGAASGIGEAITRRLHRSGHRVVCADIDGAAAERVSSELSTGELESSVLAVELDVTSAASWSDAVSRATAFGSLRGLVNNAGITRDKSMLSMPEAAFDDVLGVHVKGSWLGCRACIPELRKASGASIVNVSSSGRHGVFGQSNYSPAKAAIIGLTKTVAIEQARYAIRCNAVAPGAINTPMTAAVPDDVRDGFKQATLLGRIGEPDEVAAAVEFLLSDASSYVNASVLEVNGGEAHL